MGHMKRLTKEEREKLISDGFRPVEIWVPNLDDPKVLKHWQEGTRRASEADRKDGTNEFLEGVLCDLIAEDKG